MHKPLNPKVQSDFQELLNLDKDGASGMWNKFDLFFGPTKKI
jgi:hypothetical protein